MKARHADIADTAFSVGLAIAGVAPVTVEDNLPDTIRSVVLLAPDEPRFWPMFTEAPEYDDGLPDALDRWSRRVIGNIAQLLNAQAYFPFGGEPFKPFLSWALRSGRCWSSPVGLLVHDATGLFVSFRGAIGLPETVSTTTRTSPCANRTTMPCKTGCPAAALTPQRYDVPACKAWLGTDAGAICHGGGCLVRRACPIGAEKRLAAQSAFHMEAFLQI